MEFEITKSNVSSNFADVSTLETPHLDEKRVNKHLKTFPINVMNDRLMTTEVKVESPNWNVEGNTKGLIKMMNTWFNYYKQIENNLVVGAKAVFLVCRDLYDAQQNLPPKEFELLKKKIHLSEPTISKYIIVGKSTLCRELFTMNRLPESWTTMYKIAKVKEADKQEKIKDPEKLKFISNEYLVLKNQLNQNIKSDDKLNKLFKSLKDINAKLWAIEDDKRQCEKDKDFGEKFIKLSRDVHFLNDDRAKIKLEINNHTGSKIKEIKEYTSY